VLGIVATVDNLIGTWWSSK